MSTNCVYIIGREYGPVKVGLTSSLESRFRTIQTSCPFPIRILHAVPMRDREHAIWHEQNFHAVCADRRLNGEWFNMDAELAIEVLDGALEVEAIFEERERNGEYA